MSSQKHPTMVKVWDPLVRIFHWSLVILFSIAYVSEDNLMQVHVWAGYGILGLVAFRLVWGAIGTRHARFSDFVKKPQMVFHYLHDMLHGGAKRHLGHNPAGGAMVLLLLAFLTSTGISGVALYGIEESMPVRLPAGFKTGHTSWKTSLKRPMNSWQIRPCS